MDIIINHAQQTPLPATRATYPTTRIWHVDPSKPYLQPTQEIDNQGLAVKNIPKETSSGHLHTVGLVQSNSRTPKQVLQWKA